VVAPQKIIQQMGADILRLWIASADYSADIRISDEILKQLAESYRRIRNTIRFLMSNLEGFDPEVDSLPLSKRTQLDKWAMYELAHLSSQVTKFGYETYQFHHIHQRVHNYCSVTLGGFYLDVIKDRVYCDEAVSHRRQSARSTMYDITNVLIRLIAPIIPITAEEAWEYFSDSGSSIHLELFEPVEDSDVGLFPWVNTLLPLRDLVNSALDDAKKDKIVGASLAAQVNIPGLDLTLAEQVGETFEQLFMVAKVTTFDGEGITVTAAEGTKCPRCYVVGEPADATHEVHNKLCDRCLEVVTG